MRIHRISIPACYSMTVTKLTAARALTAHIAQRVFVIAVIIVVVSFVILLAVIWALAHFVSAWWWLLLVPFLFIFGILSLLGLFIRFIILRIYSQRLRPEQKKALGDFMEKVQGLIEARGTPPQLFILITIKDLVLHRDITTIKKLIRDSSSLKRDFSELERLF